MHPATKLLLTGLLLFLTALASCASSSGAADSRQKQRKWTKKHLRNLDETAPNPDAPPPVSIKAPGKAVEPGVSALGSDVSTLPKRYPDAEWMPIEAPVLSTQLEVTVKVNGRETIATLDTGAESTVMSMPVAMRLGLLNENTPRGDPIRVQDAHGNIMEAEKISLGNLTLGKHRWADVSVTVLGKQPNLFLVGEDVLRDVDLYVASDEALVGLFEAGTAPRSKNDVVADINESESQMRILGTAPSASGDDVHFRFIIDTGASGSTLPIILGLNAGLPTDTKYTSTTLAVGGRQTDRGRFFLNPLTLGRMKRVNVGPTLPQGSTADVHQDLGLLGNDVMMRTHTIISYKRKQLRFLPPVARPSTRMRGPKGVTCKNEQGKGSPCVQVAMRAPPASWKPQANALPDRCLDIKIDPVYKQKTVELAITADNHGEQVFFGGALRAFVTVGPKGTHTCFSLWKQLDHLGLQMSSKLSLRWVRTEGVHWPCDPSLTFCMGFTGPLADLPIQ